MAECLLPNAPLLGSMDIGQSCNHRCIQTVAIGLTNICHCQFQKLPLPMPTIGTAHANSCHCTCQQLPLHVPTVACLSGLIFHFQCSCCSVNEISFSLRRKSWRSEWRRKRRKSRKWFSSSLAFFLFLIEMQPSGSELMIIPFSNQSFSTFFCLSSIKIRLKKLLSGPWWMYF